MTQLASLILAAGKGVRMRSALPKVLHPVGGIPMIQRVLTSLKPFGRVRTAVIVGHGGDRVKEFVRAIDPQAQFFRQRVLNGSGGAVREALSWLKKQNGDVIVSCGDAPLFRAETLQQLVVDHRASGAVATVLSTRLDNPLGYGRIVRTQDGSVAKIVEELDATETERKINEINTGTYCFNAKLLAKALPRLKNNNEKKEFYLTDVLEILRRDGGLVSAVVCADAGEALGINSRADLAKAMGVLYRRKVNELMRDGVTIVDPASTFIDDQVTVGADTVIWPQTFIRGASRIGSNCEIGPWAHISNTTIENDVSFRCSFADDALVRKGALVGPYSRLRPKADVGPGAHVGNFSELKNTQLGAGSKINHLSYLGDAKVGKNVNIGAGTITCNYDGINKFPTSIQDHAFIGSNTNLIAPITVGAHAVVGAGSSLSEDVPAWSLVFERAAATVKKNWAKKKFKGKKK